MNVGYLVLHLYPYETRIEFYKQVKSIYLVFAVNGRSCYSSQMRMFEAGWIRPVRSLSKANMANTEASNEAADMFRIAEFSSVACGAIGAITNRWNDPRVAG